MGILFLKCFLPIDTWYIYFIYFDKKNLIKRDIILKKENENQNCADMFYLFLKIGVFLEDQSNLKLFNNTAIPEDVRNYYIMQLYAFNPTYSVIKWVSLVT